MEKSPNKIIVEEIQQLFVAKPKTEENGSVSKLICTQAKAELKTYNFNPKKKKNHFIKRRK